jgi:long-chain acyl-CoA synthetase
MNVHPEDLETVLRQQPEIRDAIVIGLKRERNAEPCAVVILREMAADAGPAIRRANESLAEFQRLRSWYVWPEEDFPRTPTQKPRLNIIEERVHAQLAGTGAAPRGSLADILERITGRPNPAISSGTNLATDLNLSSIERVELMSALEDRYQTDLNESKFTAATTVGELESMLREPELRRSDYAYPRWAQRWPVTALRTAVYYLVSWPATYLMTPPRIVGKENLRDVSGPLLIVANHITQVDVGYVLAALPVRIRHRLTVAMLGEMLQDMRNPPADLPWQKQMIEKISYFLLVALFNVFPLPQQTGFRRSFAYAGESADHGYSILVFPEGRRTPDGKLSAFRNGVGMLARNLGLPVVVFRIDGLFDLKLKGRKFARPGAVTVKVGSPIRFGPDEDAETITRKLEQYMTAL